MAWKEVSTNAIDIKKEEQKGKEWIGEYQGNHKIQTQLGEQTIYKFLGEDGTYFSIYGFTNLNRAMDNVPLNSNCRIIYQGTQKVDTKYKKGQEVHQVSVEIEDSEEERPPAIDDTRTEDEKKKDRMPF
jgi:hypothetical protein